MSLNKIIAIILLIGFIAPLITLISVSYCEEGSVTDCLVKIEPLMPDFYWHHNVIKYLAAYGEIPEYVVVHKNGGEDGASLEGEMKPVFHSPLYYYLGAGVLNLSKNIGLNSLLALHVFSLVLISIGNFLAFLLFKKISRYVRNKKQFIISAVSLSVFLPMHLYIGVAVHNHVLFYLFMILSFYLYSLFLEEKTLKRALLLGGALGLSLLSNLAGLVLIAVLGSHVVFDYFKKKWREGNLLLLSVFIGSIMGAYVLIRNYILFNDLIWGGINNFAERNLFVLVRAAKAYFGGIYGGHDLLSPLIWLASILVILIGIYGVLKSRLWRKEFSFIWMVGVLMILLGIHTVCNLFYISNLSNNFSCLGANLVHGRYFLAAGPMLVLFFSLGFVNMLKDKRKIKYTLIGIICLVYLLDFIYALVTF